MLSKTISDKMRKGKNLLPRPWLKEILELIDEDIVLNKQKTHVVPSQGIRKISRKNT